MVGSYLGNLNAGSCSSGLCAGFGDKPMRKLDDAIKTLKPSDVSPEFLDYQAVLWYEMTLSPWKRRVRSFLRVLGVRVFGYKKKDLS